MTTKKLGGQTAALACPPSLLSFANVVGKKEGEGPLAACFDYVDTDDAFGASTWEQSERAMQQKALTLALEKAGPGEGQLDWLFAGDLLNQCISSSFAARDQKCPFFGLYGACSTMGEGLALAAMTLDGGFGQRAGVVVSSHFCTAERQYRMPVPYGSQRTPTAQWTTTAAGCTILGSDGPGPYVTHVTCGRIVDKGITDANNMGAAMAPAAYDTLSAFFRDTGYKPADFDLILTGDLGELGHAIVRDFFQWTWAPSSRTAACCCMTGSTRICTPEPPAAAALPPCSTAISCARCGRASGRPFSSPPPGRCSPPPLLARGSPSPPSATPCA